MSKNIMAKKIDSIYPLSPIQQGMLFHALYSQEDDMYIEQWACTLRGELDLSALRESWQLVVDRHPILRTAFVWEGLEEPLQVVGQRVKLPWKELDWRNVPADEQKEKLEEFLQSDREEGFVLTKAP